MNFTLHQLQIFLEVCEHRSITKAAESMYLTQPALSIQLKNFQQQFDVPLTEIIGRKLYVTDFGHAIGQIAKNILKEAEELKFKTKAYKGLLAGKLKISSASTGKYVIPYFLTGFIALHPGIDLSLDVSNKTLVMQNLERNEVDFALVSVIPDQYKVDEEILMENRLFLVGPSKAYNKKIPLIYREQGSATRNAMDSYFNKTKKRKSIELTSNEAVKQAVISGLGNSIIPLIGIKNELLNEQLFIIPQKNLPLLTHWRLIWLKNKKLSPIAKSYLNYIQDNKESIIDLHFSWVKKLESI